MCGECFSADGVKLLKGTRCLLCVTAEPQTERQRMGRSETRTKRRYCQKRCLTISGQPYNEQAMAERGTKPTRQCVHREGCHQQDMRVRQSDPERRDHPQNTEEATLSTAKMAHRTHTETFTSRVHWKTFRTEALVEQYGPPVGWNNEVNNSHDVASRQRMAVLLCQLSMYKET